MPAPEIILQLVERFSRNLEDYKAGKYKEAQLRQEFIDPFFEALGWDVRNIQGFAEAYKDVIHEDAIRIGSATKAPDYCFRIGGVRKFFVEAKAPDVNVRDDASAAYQLRRYAWSAKLPLSILTDFEEFAVYDCRFKPQSTDPASSARIKLIRFDEYAEHWDEIADVFHKGAILKGSFDRYAEATKQKRGTAEVDDSFLKEIESWREILAKNIALRNPQLSQKELNFAVQRIIDRIIFLRICEDRAIETYGQLLSLLNGEDTYLRLARIFHQADDKYNSGLFHFKVEKERSELPDKVTLGLHLDDKVLKEIIKSLYYPYSPYEFSVLSADILGHVYEQFLGKVIRLTAGHQARVEEKPEVRKAGGVYYTPTYIVDYIVKNTVGRLLEKKTPKEAAKIKILDPACGSGSFLIGAYQFLLDWYRDYYINNDPLKYSKSRNPPVFRSNGGGWKLTTGEKKRILLNNIYGVDIDSQAVEVTKLSLLLKVLEGENEDTIQRQIDLFHERALPDLGNNIKCGNSLVGHDFYEDYSKQVAIFDEEELLKINAFDWRKEFTEIFKKNKGFSIIIGNPPYGASSLLEEDTYISFIKKSEELLTRNGLLSMIVPTSWLSGVKYKKFRQELLENFTFESIISLPFNVFKECYVDTCVFVFNFGQDKQKPQTYVYSYSKKEKITSLEKAEKNYQRLLKKHILDDENLSISVNPIVYRVKNKFTSKQFIALGKLSFSTIGVLASKYKITNKPTKNCFKYFIGNINRYSCMHQETRYIDLSNHAESYLDYYFGGKKIWVRRLINRQDRIMCTIPHDNFIIKKDIYSFTILPDYGVKEEYILGLLNSKLLSFLYLNLSAISTKDDFRQTTLAELRALPIRVISFANEREEAIYNKILFLVSAILKFNQRVPEVRLEQEKIALQRQIEATDDQIDRLIYELYGLTDEEIKIVESATGEK